MKRKIKYKLKEERIDKIKKIVYEHLDTNKRRCATVFRMVNNIKSNMLNEIMIRKQIIMRHILALGIIWSSDREKHLNILQDYSKST